MAAREGALRLERLREAVAERVNTYSLRQVARAVGMSPTGLQKFLDGATPYAATRRKLERWYVREAASTPGAIDAESARAALLLLGQDLPATERRKVLMDIVLRLEAAYHDANLETPAWLAELRAEFCGEGA